MSNLKINTLRRIAELFGLLPNAVLKKNVKIIDNLSFCRFSHKKARVASGLSLRLGSGEWCRMLFFTTVYRTILRHKNIFSDISPCTVSWSERFTERVEERLLIAEHGWLPRHYYQISSKGANARSHIRYSPHVDYFTKIGDNYFDHNLFYARASLGILSRGLEYAKQIGNVKFILVPFQGANDFNLKYSESNFSHLYGKSNKVFAQEIIDHVYSEKIKEKIVFTEHPSCPIDGKLSIPDNMIFLGRDIGQSSIELATSSNCIGVASVNSNILHEAMLYSVPVCAWGSLLNKVGCGPFLNNINEIVEIFCCEKKKEIHKNQCKQYLSLLFMNQWTINDLANPYTLRKIIENPEICPFELRKHSSINHLCNY